MDINSLSLPHPVLGIGDDVIGKYEIIPEKEIFIDRIIIKINHVLDNKTISEMISKKSAVFGVELDCPQTVYRKMFLTEKNSQEIIIDADELRGRVNIDYYILSNTNITDYKPSSVNIEYENAVFNVSKGEVLAYGGSSFFYADKRWKESESVSSFMCIVKSDKKEGPVDYELMSDKILISLPEKDYYNYKKAGGEFKKIYNVYHGALVYPALLYALIRMFGSSEGDEMLQTYSWYSQLSDRLDADSRFKGVDRTVEKAPLIAQMLLSKEKESMPISRTLECVKTIIDDQYKINEEE